MTVKRVSRPNRLPVLRAERDISQLDLAVKVGMSHNRYWRVENGYTEPTDEERNTLASTLGVPVAEIWAPSEEVA